MFGDILSWRALQCVSPSGVIALWVQESMHWYGFENKSMYVRVMHIKVVILAKNNLGVGGFSMKSGLTWSLLTL